MAVLFDFDEVLGELPRDFNREVYEHVIATMPQLFQEVPEFSEADVAKKLAELIDASEADLFSGLAHRKKSEVLKGLYSEYGNDVVEKSKRVYWDYHDTRKAEVVQFVEGADKTLRWLQKNDIPFAVVSNAKTVEPIRALLEPEFHDVPVLHDAQKPRDTIGVQGVTRFMGLNASTRVVFVGDRKDTDVELANALGFVPVLLKHPDTEGFQKAGSLTPERLRRQNPAYEADNHEGLREILSEQLLRSRYSGSVTSGFTSP